MASGKTEFESDLMGMVPWLSSSTARRNIHCAAIFVFSQRSAGFFLCFHKDEFGPVLTHQSLSKALKTLCVEISLCELVSLTSAVTV